MRGLSKNPEKRNGGEGWFDHRAGKENKWNQRIGFGNSTWGSLIMVGRVVSVERWEQN